LKLGPFVTPALAAVLYLAVVAKRIVSSMKTAKSSRRTSMNILDVDECLVLLRWEAIGRLAVCIPDHAPSVVPVNFALSHGTIVFRTDDGQKHDHLMGRQVSFQVDRFDWFRRIGWSVLVQGVAHEADPSVLEGVELESWVPGHMPHVVQIVPTSITGRRLQLNVV